ncbi:MAG: peptidyl-tRNA hydrolase [Candidatus Campbellbacteria bacterium]
MNYLIIGLGNPGENYEGTRHNVGRMFVDFVRTQEDFPEWENEKKAVAQLSKGKIGKHDVFLSLPDTFMNKSGSAAAYLARARKVKSEHVVVAYDDIDLPLGTLKISFDRGSGGHRGLESVIKALKTREFLRVRFGISGATPKGKTKKPQGEEKVLKFLLGAFKKEELTALKKIFKKAHEAIEVAITEGREKAMSQFN